MPTETEGDKRPATKAEKIEQLMGVTWEAEELDKLRLSRKRYCARPRSANWKRLSDNYSPPITSKNLESHQIRATMTASSSG